MGFWLRLDGALEESMSLSSCPRGTEQMSLFGNNQSRLHNEGFSCTQSRSEASSDTPPPLLGLSLDLWLNQPFCLPQAQGLSLDLQLCFAFCLWLCLPVILSLFLSTLSFILPPFDLSCSLSFSSPN